MHLKKEKKKKKKITKKRKRKGEEKRKKEEKDREKERKRKRERERERERKRKRKRERERVRKKEREREGEREKERKKKRDPVSEMGSRRAKHCLGAVYDVISLLIEWRFSFPVIFTFFLGPLLPGQARFPPQTVFDRGCASLSGWLSLSLFTSLSLISCTVELRSKGPATKGNCSLRDNGARS